MYKFPIYNYTCFSELPLEQLNQLNFSVYILDFEWNYLFVNNFACKRLNKSSGDLLGANMWEMYKELQTDPVYMQMKKNAANGIASDLTTISPVTGHRVNIKDYRLEDCYYFSVSTLPNKETLMDELRGEMEKYKSKS